MQIVLEPLVGQKDKFAKLEKIARQIKNCETCKVGKSGLAVPGEGNPNAQVVFLGEAPGKQEALTGRPFIGRSGQLLRGLIKEIELDGGQVFITSAVKYLPDSGTPSRLDIEHGKVHLFKQLDIIQPKVIVLLGNTAAQAILNQVVLVSKSHGEVFEQGRYKLFLTYHPAAALRFPPNREILKKDFQKLKTFLQREKIIS